METALLICFLLLSSCSARINGVLRQGGSADLTIQVALEPRMSSLIRSLNAVMGHTSSELILDGDSISSSMAASPGISSVNLVNTGPAALEGGVAVSRVEDFISAVGERRFISYWEGLDRGRSSGRILITLDRETISELLVLFSTQAIDYLTALMAPAVLGDDISKEEYLVLVNSLYGQGIVDEIRDAMILASIDFPAPITAIRGGTVSGSRRAEFALPLLDLLVLENPMSWEVSWQQ